MVRLEPVPLALCVSASLLYYYYHAEPGQRPKHRRHARRAILGSAGLAQVPVLGAVENSDGEERA